MHASCVQYSLVIECKPPSNTIFNILKCFKMINSEYERIIWYCTRRKITQNNEILLQISFQPVRIPESSKYTFIYSHTFFKQNYTLNSRKLRTESESSILKDIGMWGMCTLKPYRVYRFFSQNSNCFLTSHIKLA